MAVVGSALAGWMYVTLGLDSFFKLVLFVLAGNLPELASVAVLPHPLLVSFGPVCGSY